jgi:hypothetical protein
MQAVYGLGGYLLLECCHLCLVLGVALHSDRLLGRTQQDEQRWHRISLHDFDLVVRVDGKVAKCNGRLRTNAWSACSRS